MRPKSLFFAFMLLAGVVMGSMCFYGCDSTSLDSDTAKELPSLPKLEDVDDVCLKMTDINFMAYCYDNFDVNSDGMVSMIEANAVKSISCSTAEDFTGIGYFSNLESFESYSAKYLDLRYNTKLTDIRLAHYNGMAGPNYGSSIEQLDLSYCVNLTLIGSTAFYACKSLTTIDLPSSLKEIGYGAFWYSTNLKTVTSRASTPPTLGSNAFSGIDDSAILYVPSESVEAYEASDWAIWFTAIEAIN